MKHLHTKHDKLFALKLWTSDLQDMGVLGRISDEFQSDSRPRDNQRKHAALDVANTHTSSFYSCIIRQAGH
jgi:hypothetical protein